MSATQAKAVFGIAEDSCCPPGPIDFSILTDMADVGSIATEWDDLLAKSRVNRAYSCSKWYLATVELAPRLQPLAFAVYRNGILAGILPLWLDVSERLATIGDNFIDHSDIIAEDDDWEVIAGLLDFALKGTGAYDHLFLGQVKLDSNYVKAAKALVMGETVDQFFLPDKSFKYAVLDIRLGYDEYMKTLGPRSRFNLQCDCKRAKRDGLIVCELTPAELSPDLLPETFWSLHVSRFGDRSGFRAARSWIQKLFPSLFAERRMRVFAVLDKNQVVGIDLALAARSGMYAFAGGFLPEIRRYAPGKLLIHKAIEKACQEGMAEFDLGWWRQDHKGHWKPAVHEVSRLWLPVYPRQAHP